MSDVRRFEEVCRDKAPEKAGCNVRWALDACYRYFLDGFPKVARCAAEEDGAALPSPQTPYLARDKRRDFCDETAGAPSGLRTAGSWRSHRLRAILPRNAKFCSSSSEVAAALPWTNPRRGARVDICSRFFANQYQVTGSSLSGDRLRHAPHVGRSLPYRYRGDLEATGLWLSAYDRYGCFRATA